MSVLRGFDLSEVFEVAGWPASQSRDAEIRARFGLSETVFWQAFLPLTRDPDVYARFPVQCARFDRLRAKNAAERDGSRITRR